MTKKIYRITIDLEPFGVPYFQRDISAVTDIEALLEAIKIQMREGEFSEWIITKKELPNFKIIG